MGKKIIKNIINKAEFVKPGVKAAEDPLDLLVAHKVANKHIKKLLVNQLTNMEIGENKDISGDMFLLLSVEDLDPDNRNQYNLHISKVAKDTYNGYLTHKGQNKFNFNYRSILGLSLLLSSFFENYDYNFTDNNVNVENYLHDLNRNVDQVKILLENNRQNVPNYDINNLSSMVELVVTQKLAEKEALNILMENKIQNFIKPLVDEIENMKNKNITENAIEISDIKPESENDKLSKKNKLREYVYKKNEVKINCPDCRELLTKKSETITLCICYGQDQHKDIKFTKSEDGNFKIKNIKKIDPENMAMLLDAIRNSK
jgi:hypothetical protein